MGIGKEIRKAAIDEDMTLGAVADKAGMKRTRFSQCINGHTDFTADELTLIGAAVGVQAWELMRRATESDSEAA